MHIELNPKYGPLLASLVVHLDLEAGVSNSFSASGETIILSAPKEELEKILNAKEEHTGNFAEENQQRGFPPVYLEGLKAIIKDHLDNLI